MYKRLRWSLLLLPLIALAIPIRIVFLNEWIVRVRDEKNVELPNISIEQSWDSYTFNDRGSRSLRTDSSGLARFSEVSVRRTVAEWVVRTIPVLLNVHGSWGDSAGSVRVFDDAVEGTPGMGAGSDSCGNRECTNHPHETEFQVYLAERSEGSTRQLLQTNGVALEKFAEDWIRENSGGYIGTRDRNGSYRWGFLEIDEFSPGKFTVSSINGHRTQAKANSLQDAAKSMGESGQEFLLWLKSAEMLGIYSVTRTEEGGAIEFRLPPGGHGLYYVPRQTASVTQAYLLSLGRTGSKTNSLGVIKQLSERWFFFLDFAPGWRARKP
jgi:hypothetical protein